jgi:phenylalanyl-tRNA synthetase alpha chain
MRNATAKPATIVEDLNRTLRELNIAIHTPQSVSLQKQELSKALREFTANTALLQAASTSTRQLDDVKTSLLGKKSEFEKFIRSLSSLRQALGHEPVAAANAAKKELTQQYQEAKELLQSDLVEQQLPTETLDMTLPVDLGPQGSVHPVSQVMDELAEIFADLGFAVATGPEIEDDWHNFTALNFPPDHPAKAMHDTFYFERTDASGQPMLLRTHTSPVQIRAMQAQEPPIYVIAPGRTYRSDSDATHTPMFHQIEGLVIDRGITLGHLKWTLETFLKAYFERDDIVLRLRPSYFPFTEPSAEVDVGYTIQNGRRVLGGADHWMELLGSGMVHPNVLRNCGLDPDEWQGFAFGCGIDRLAMLKYGMDDLRAFFDGDLRWLRHYGFAALDVPTLSGGVGA